MRLISLLLAMVLGVGAFFLVQKATTEKEEKVKEVIVEVEKVKVQQVPTVDVLVARRDIPVGSRIDAGMLDRQPWPSHLLLDSFIVSDGKDAGVQGLVTRAPFQAREPMIRNKLSNPNDPSFLAANLPEGMRAVSIAVDRLSSVSGFIYPGDRVDVLLNHKVELPYSDPRTGSMRIERQDFVEILLPNIKIIAIDQQASATNQQGSRVPSTVTFEATREDAQRLKLAESKGKMTLVLRSISDGEEDKSIVKPTGESDLSSIVPPTIFPVLYKSNGESVAADTINPFEVMGDDSAGVSAEVKAAIRQSALQSSAIAVGSGVSPAVGMSGGFGSLGMSGSAPEEDEEPRQIRVVRGVSEETIEIGAE